MTNYRSLDDKMLVQNLQNDTVILCIPSHWHSHSTANNSHWPIITHHFFCFTNHLSANLLVSIFYLVCILASFKITSEITLCTTISDKKIFWETQGAKIKVSWFGKYNTFLTFTTVFPIILDPLGNIYDIYANLTVMNLFNLNHFWIARTDLCLKGTFVKACFISVTIFGYLWKS